MKKKIVIGIATFVALAGIAFCASCYKYTYVVHVKCISCYGHQDITVEANDDSTARSKAEDIFSNHTSDCQYKFGTGRLRGTISSRHTNDYTDCD